ncbi:MAG: FtsW/RodA/SpoVE family cell cycle protein, partial [Lentisphaeria bacterium]|nr:FtsW/RodA/SpoVE family cell cycle protein [Lentisphaeria bacterium]
MIYHIFVNIGMSIGVAPVTGVPLPFVSYGGSFMLTVMASCGVLQSIYRHRRVEL